MIKLIYKNRIISKIILGLIACLLVIAASVIFWQPENEKINLSFSGKKWFDKSILLTDIYRIFDLGIVDVNFDNNLDIFTSNHNHGQLLLLGNGQGNFSDNVTSDWGLDQDREFPGLEYAGQPPKIEKSGVYIYWKERNLIIENNHSNTAIKGTIDFWASVNIQQQKNFDIKVKKETINNEIETSQIDFLSQSKTGIFDFIPDNVSLPISFQLDEKIPLENVFIGNRQLHPQSHRFTFYLRDRHGMAWTDYDNSGKMDVFIVRGGLKGRMDVIPHQFNDELLVNNQGDSYEEVITDSGLLKQGCPALQTAWVDINNDQLLDLYTVCYRGAKSDQTEYFNQLHQQQSKHNFIEVANQANLAFSEMGTFTWFDADRDGDMDLLWVNNEAFWLYRNEKGVFRAEKIAQNPGKVWRNFENGTSKLTLADYDADGDIDIFFVSDKGNALLENKNDNYQLIPPTSVGLPDKGLTANWVDYDNDGLTDIHLIPGGLYRQQKNHQFENTEMLASHSNQLVEARANWLDIDNNGTRDLLLATRYEDSLWERIYKKLVPQLVKTPMWNIAIYPNLGSTNNWLEINLVGDSRNPQGIGSQVEVNTANKIQIQTIGQAEGSHFSQGHYRLYFGLGKQTNVDSVKVLWSDGYTQQLNNVASNQLLTITKKDS